MTVLIKYIIICLTIVSCNSKAKIDSKKKFKKPTPTEKKIEPIIQSNTTNDLSSLFKELKSSVFIIYTSDGNNTFQGTGFFINSMGKAVSNFHVFENTNYSLAYAVINNQKYIVSNLTQKNKDIDYCTFRLDGMYGNDYLKTSKTTPNVGEEVFTIGNPEGLEHTLSKGIVSALRGENIIQTTTEITHGSSGGPLLNMKGEVVGITTSGMGEANLNFAINIRSLNL